MSKGAFPSWFRSLFGSRPHTWQVDLARHTGPGNRLIRVPTGLGKTVGVLSTWTYHRVVQRESSWPRRLVWCLPMRVLVEQTQAIVVDWLDRLGLAWDGRPETHTGRVGVHALMGGVALDEWHLYPEHEAVLIGTQDMLLSRALNRGYGSARARWPMEYALLHSDALWVLDEVQLMDVGLITSVQLQAMRTPGAKDSVVPLAKTWWMSATLQPRWLESVDFSDELRRIEAATISIPADQRTGVLFDARKPLRVAAIPDAEDKRSEVWADAVLDLHDTTEAGEHGRITLAMVNTVEAAIRLWQALEKKLKKREGIELRLVHSRFRGLERREWRESFLCREACSAEVDRIVVATQVVEAGVDVSSTALVTQLAPWPSLVQRFGRAARYGGQARVLVVDRVLAEKQCAPYEAHELEAAREALGHLRDVSLHNLEQAEDRWRSKQGDFLARLYPYDPLHRLTPREFRELFDTGSDLTGADIDVSRFIRSGDERDVHVWWWRIGEGEPAEGLHPLRDALCPVPVGLARSWLLEQTRLKEGCRAWAWDYLEGRWRILEGRDVYPGQTLLVDSAWGGYDTKIGWTGERAVARGPEIPTEGTLAQPSRYELADRSQDHEDLSVYPYKTIATHGREAGEEATRLAKVLQLPDRVAALLDLAGRLHDLGKAHPAFQGAIDPNRRAPGLSGRQDLAKAPDAVWKRGPNRFGSRRGFRHELASALGILEALRCVDPWHPALLGPHRLLVDANAFHPELEGERLGREVATGVLAELLALDTHELDLVLYLVCCHHGKVRASWQATPYDQEFHYADDLGPPLRGVRNGDVLPSTLVAASGTAATAFPEVELHLDPAALGLSPRYGASWRERVGALRRIHGDPSLAYLEALLRVADVRASRRETPDPLLGAGGET